jgi:N-acetylglucosaminyldiphosphoundecaprenol N-acetyl-beta-D-mannosaminyltransferase
LPNINIVDPNATSRHQTRPWLDELVASLRSARPDIILLGLGFPRQELAAAYITERINHGIIIGEGGTFDYRIFGGRTPKAPALMQRLGIEWLWRLALQPSRLRRQLAIPRFIYRIWLSRC